MISAAVRASPRSEFPNVLSFAADEKVCSHLFHRVRLSVILQYVNNWVLEIMRCGAAAETKRWRRSFGLSSRENWDNGRRGSWSQWYLLMWVAQRARLLGPNHRTDRVSLWIQSIHANLSDLAEDAHRLKDYKGEHTIETINLFSEAL